MKMDTTDRTFVLVESIDQSAHTIIPELDHATVQTGEDPWAFGVEGEALDSVTLRLELRQHDIFFSRSRNGNSSTQTRSQRTKGETSHFHKIEIANGSGTHQIARSQNMKRRRRNRDSPQIGSDQIRSRRASR